MCPGLERLSLKPHNEDDQSSCFLPTMSDLTSKSDHWHVTFSPNTRLQASLTKLLID